MIQKMYDTELIDQIENREIKSGKIHNLKN